MVGDFLALVRSVSVRVRLEAIEAGGDLTRLGVLDLGYFKLGAMPLLTSHLANWQPHAIEARTNIQRFEQVSFSNS
jgi:hypothetical protein